MVKPFIAMARGTIELRVKIKHNNVSTLRLFCETFSFSYFSKIQSDKFTPPQGNTCLRVMAEVFKTK